MEERQQTDAAQPGSGEAAGTPWAPFRWYIHPAFLVLACLAATVLIVFLYLRGRNSAAGDAVEERLAAIREKGEPVTAEELAPPPVPDGENAAPLLQAAFDAQIEWEEQERAGIKDWEDLLSCEGEPDLTLAKRALDLHADAVAKARLALARPKCRFDLDYSQSYAMLLPHLANLRALARLFALEALVRSAEGRGDEAAESCLAALALGRMLEAEPILISQLVRIAITEIAVRSARHSLQRVAFPDEAVLRIRERLLEIDPASFSRIGLRGERVFLRQTFDAFASGKDTIGDVSGADKALLQRVQRAGTFVFLEDEAFALDALARALEAIELPPHESVPSVNAVFAEAEAEAHEHTLKHVLSGLLLPALRAAHTRAVRTWARRDGAIIGLSCELFRSGRGRYPATLDELAPEFLKDVPPDPFTGKPFKYELRDDGAAFIVYSLGDNLKDDGGVERDHKEAPDCDDIAWEGKERGEAAELAPAIEAGRE
jgi:hypothetical protein